MTINISITDKRATALGAPVIICGNSGYSIEFTFDDEWAADAAKTARFVYVKDGTVQHEDKPFTGTTVAVPVLLGVREVFVGLFAGDLQTSTPARIPCEPSILCNSGPGVDNAYEAGVKAGVNSILCKTITEINDDSLTEIPSYTLYQQTSLARAVFTSVTKVHNYAFSGCTALTHLELPEAVEVEGFGSCSALTHVELPKVKNINTAAFTGCSALPRLVLPNVVSINTNAFGNCTSLAYVDCGHLVSVAALAFRGCSALTSLIIRRPKKSSSSAFSLANANAFTGTPIANGTGYIYVYRDWVESLKTAPNWSTYADQIRAIEDYPEITGG